MLLNIYPISPLRLQVEVTLFLLGKCMAKEAFENERQGKKS